MHLRRGFDRSAEEVRIQNNPVGRFPVKKADNFFDDVPFPAPMVKLFGLNRLSNKYLQSCHIATIVKAQRGRKTRHQPKNLCSIWCTQVQTVGWAAVARRLPIAPSVTLRRVRPACLTMMGSGSSVSCAFMVAICVSAFCF